MKLKNEALEKLYGTIVNSTITISPFSESPVDEAFKECDRELTNIQNRNDILEKSNGTLLEANLDLCSKNRDLKNRLDKANADRTALQKNLDYYMDIYKKVQDDYDELHNKYSECQGTVDKQAEQIRNLKAKQDSVRKNCYDQGQTDLWVKLQDVKDMQPNEFDVECECLGDVIDMDLEDFLDSYKKWWEQKETDRMRDYLERFCIGRLCYNCPLYTDGFNCSLGKWMAGIPDKDVKRYYEADTKITENLRKGCTFEAEVNVNKDLFEKLCGMKSEEKKSKPGELVITTRGVATANYNEATMNAIKEAVRRFEKSLPALDSWESTITGSIKVDDILGKKNTK